MSDKCAETGKVIHSTRRAAEDAMHALIRNTGAFRVTTYGCQSCHGFHVGHDPKWLKQDIKGALSAGRAKGRRHKGRGTR